MSESIKADLLSVNLQSACMYFMLVCCLYAGDACIAQNLGFTFAHCLLQNGRHDEREREREREPNCN